MKVLKFGGSSLADAKQFQKVKDIILSESSRRYVVASAPGKRFSDDEKVTDLLYKCYNNKDNESCDAIFDKIASRYHEIINDLGLDFSIDDDLAQIKHELKVRPSVDYMASRGEFLNSKILAVFLNFDFIDAAGHIFFKEDGSLDLDKTAKVFGEELKKHEYAVIPGFYGSMPDGSIKTFSRGGSDITGSIVACAAQADIYENWTDVSGMLMADPRYVENPRTIDYITYRELRELAYMGASVMHEEAIFPVRVSNIPINIRNTNAPDKAGTMILSKLKEGTPTRTVTGIAGKPGFSTIYVEKDLMNSEIGFGRRILQVLENHSLSFEHIPTGIDVLSVIVSTESLTPCREQVIEEIKEAVNPDSVSIEDGLALIAVVGNGMINKIGVSGRLFSAIGRASINIRMLDQGSKGLNIILGVDEENYIPALNAIYKEFM